MIRALPLLALAVAGCASAPSPELKDEALRTVPTCASPKECEVKWSAARTWIATNAGFKLQTDSPDLLETYNATGSSTELAVRVIRQARPDGTYRLAPTIGCDNYLGCRIEPWTATVQFNRFVNSAWAPAR